MAGTLVVMVVIAVLGLIGFIAWWSWKKEKERKEFLRTLASEWGMQFEEIDYSTIPSQYKHLNGFNVGHGRYAYNILRGKYHGQQACAFDYKYTTTETYTDSKGNVRTRQVNHYFSSVVIDMPYRFPAELFIRREGMLDRLAGFIGFEDIDFESDEFSRKFMVKCTDRRFAYDVVHPRIMEMMLKDFPYQLELDGRQIHIRGHGRFEKEQFPRAMNDILQFVDLLPEHLLQELKTREHL